MNEQEWLECSNPSLLLRCLRTTASERKLRLFAGACCGRIWNLLTDERSRRAVEVLERLAEGAASNEDLYLAVIGAESVAKSHAETAVTASEMAIGSAAFAAQNALLPDAARAADYCAANAASAVYHAATSKSRLLFAAVERVAERDEQARLLRELFGNPFRFPDLKPSLLAWNDGMVRRIAQAIYDEKSFDKMPILADALEDAGCDDADLLSHCRGDGPHVRGCWLVDLLLGKS